MACLVTQSLLAKPEDCEKAGWSPEVLDFYGDDATIHKKLKNYDASTSLTSRRFFVVLIETEKGSEVAYFERDGNNKEKYNVMIWKTDSLEKLHKDLRQALLTRKGLGCAGVMAKDVIGKAAASSLKQGKAFSGTISASEAVKHISPAADEKSYKRVTVVILC
jgi:hypothetical protein